MRAFFTQSLRRQKPLILAFAIPMIFVLYISPNDHQLNVEPLVELNRIYDRPSYVYPPHAITLMMPFVLVGEALTRVLSVIMIGIYGLHKDWSVGRFVAVIFNPVFVYSISFTGLDVFISTDSSIVF